MKLSRSLILINITLALSPTASVAQDDSLKAVVAIVGHADRFNIGQGDFCDSRTEVSSPAGKQLRIPANRETFFYLQSSVRTQSTNHSCAGDFSFMPAPGLLHIIRFSFAGGACSLEMFQTEPGGTPRPMAVVPEQRRSCLAK